MTITLDIRPEVQAELARQAQLAGRDLEPYAATLLEDATQLPPSKAWSGSGQEFVDVFAMVRGLMTDEEIDTNFKRNGSFGRPVDFE